MLSPILARNLLLEAELLQIARALEPVEFVVLKGAPLARRLYGRLDGRQFADNDLLIRRRDIPRAVERLRPLGYALRPFHTLEGDLRVDHEVTLLRGKGGGRLEADLHWTAFSPQFFDVPEALQWSRTEAQAIRGVQVRVFDAPLTLLHLAAQFVQDLCDERLLRDISTAWNAWSDRLDVDALLELAAALKLREALTYALSAGQELGLIRVPAPETHSLRARVAKSLLPVRRALGEDRYPEYARSLLVTPLQDPRRIMSRARHVLFPPLETLSIIYEKPPSQALYLRYATRPFRPLRRWLEERHRGR